MIAAAKQALAAWQRLPGNTRGATYLVINALLSAGLAYYIRMASKTMPTAEIIFFRNLFSISILLPLAFWPGRPNAYRTKRLPLHIVRGFLSCASMACFYWSYSFLPLAESTALMFTMPLFIIVLSILFLGERVGWRRTTATMMGFGGVLLMLRPGSGTLDIALLVPLAIGLIDGTITLVVKQLTKTEKLLTIILYMGTVTFIVWLLPAYFTWKDPTWYEVFLMFMVSFFSITALVFAIMGWRAGETTVIAPVNYCQIIIIGAVGFLFFSEVPDIWAAAGAAVIVGSTLYIVQREARLKHKPMPVRADEQGPTTT